MGAMKEMWEKGYTVTSSKELACSFIGVLALYVLPFVPFFGRSYDIYFHLVCVFGHQPLHISNAATFEADCNAKNCQALLLVSDIR